jgi:hypothetical protein
MSDSFQVLSERGTLPQLAIGQIVAFSVSLRDANGDWLPIHHAEATQGVLPIEINNAPVPNNPAQISFQNLSGVAVAASAPYLIEHHHSIQLDPLDASISRLPPGNATYYNASANECQGSAFAFETAIQPIPVAPGALTFGSLSAFGGLAPNVAIAAGRLLLPPATTARAWRLQGRIAVEEATGVGANPLIQVNLCQDPDAMVPVVLQSSQLSLGISEFGEMTFDTVLSLPANPSGAQRTVGYNVGVTATAVNFGNGLNPSLTLVASSL